MNPRNHYTQQYDINETSKGRNVRKNHINHATQNKHDTNTNNTNEHENNNNTNVFGLTRLETVLWSIGIFLFGVLDVATTTYALHTREFQELNPVFDVFNSIGTIEVFLLAITAKIIYILPAFLLTHAVIALRIPLHKHLHKITAIMFIIAGLLAGGRNFVLLLQYWF